MVRFIIGAFCFTLIVIIAAWFTLKRSDIPFSSLEQRYSLSASHFVTLESGARVHYLDSGPTIGQYDPNKDTLLLLHGYTSNSSEWNEWLKELRGRYRIIAVDLPMHGLTESDMSYVETSNGMVNFIQDFTTAINLDHFSIGGTSLGGQISWEYALTNPDRVNALILIGADGWPLTENDVAFDPIVKDIQLNPWLAPVLKHFDMQTHIQARLDKCFSDPSITEQAMVKRLSDLARGPAHRKGLVKLALRKTSISLPTQFKDLKHPTLILHGEKDKIIPVRFAHEFNSAIPNSTLITYEMSGHCLVIETPRRSLDDVLSFLESVRKTHTNSKTQVLESSPPRAILNSNENSETGSEAAN
ncbi:alpha/beta fold hydrolase [Hirschia litorea]|uniref:Alpha/beta fold hydrolase n=1 Tax=Hirschia litorea TaxID=1199156 RepID=A0ABW2IN39_9PROT